MAAPVNTLTTGTLVGMREDLADVIYNIDPDETPLFSATSKAKANARYVEWQTDALRDSQDNAQLEGDDFVPPARAPTVRLGNYTQIFADGATVSGTADEVDKAGRAKEMAYQLIKVGKEIRLDIERALFANQASSAGSSVSPRRMAGLGAWISTNDNQVGGGSPASPTGNGTDTRTDGTATAFNQTRFDATMQAIYQSTGKARARTVYLSPFQMNAALGFTGNNNQRSQVTGESAKVIKDLVLYRTPWGTVEFTVSLECRPRDVWIIQDDMLSIAQLRPMKQTELAKTGDSDKRMVLWEGTLRVHNEAAHGLIPDNTIS
jgi:hypothetical protein